MMAMPRSKRLLELDALRGIAAILVVIFHCTMFRKESDYGFKLGVTGVDLFFMISGFVILLTLSKIDNWKSFAVNRFSRLFPTYWTCVTFTTLLIFFYNHYLGIPSFSLIHQYLANMTMFQQYFQVQDIDGPYWTMLIEMLFYLFMIFIFISNNLENIEVIGGILLAPILFYSTSYFEKHFPLTNYRLDHWLPLINHFPLFLAGMVFYKIKSAKPTLSRYLLIISCFLVQLMLFSIGGRSNSFISLYQYSIMLSGYFLLFILYMYDRLSFIVNRYTLFLGNISFSLYLIHQYISITIIIPWLNGHLKYNFWIAVLSDWIIILLLAYLITKFIEKPAMNYIRRKYRERSLLRRYNLREKPLQKL
jgi:peptidoglycan/LPS O-acetylase OafA/YrhL